jgi:Dolichyl-phosphate-mannose-protein mannosyltransferase
MPGSADFIQRIVHAVEAGGLAPWIKRGLVVVTVVALALYYFIWQFRGLPTSQGMDQAQIGRAIASGKGWSTNFARPLAVGQLQAHGKNVATQIWVDTYNAPLPPLIDSLALAMVRSHWKMSNTDVIYTGDKAIVVLSMILFLLSVVVLFFLARRLFDQRLAVYVCALVLLCDMMWQYSLSGLPQMLLLLLFNILLYLFARAVEAKYAGESLTVWLFAAGVVFGLLALSHALTIWIFLAALIFTIFFFGPGGWSAPIMLGGFALLYFPWLIRTYAVCGSPAGMGFYAFFDGIVKSEAAWMRATEFNPKDIGFAMFKAKISGNLMMQGDRILQYLGWNVAAGAFFIALLHPFKRSDTAALRWLVLAMWGGATLGMAVFGLTEEQGFAANQLHLLFVPIMICYGFAFLLVLWNRLELRFPFARAGFLTLLFTLCVFPMIHAMMLSGRKPLVMWPPYIPPNISILRSWMKPMEITASDMPWAIAWYADRKAVWLPDLVKTFGEFNDYGKLGGPINGIYLTPISGSGNKWGDIVKGEYKDWGGIIQRTANLKKFPLRYATLALGTNEECVFLSDIDRTKIKIQ